MLGFTNYTRLSTTLEYGPETQRGKSELINDEGKEKKDGLGLNICYYDGVMEKAETMTFLIPNFMGGSTGKSVLNDSEGNLNNTISFKENKKNKGNSKNYNNRPQVIEGDQPGTSPTYVGSIVVFLFILGVMYVKSSLRIWILLSTILSIMLGWGSNFILLTEFFLITFLATINLEAVTMKHDYRRSLVLAVRYLL